MRESFYLTLDTRDRDREEPVGRKAKEQRDRDSDRDIEEMIQLLHLTFKLFLSYLATHCVQGQYGAHKSFPERLDTITN